MMTICLWWPEAIESFQWGKRICQMSQLSRELTLKSKQHRTYMLFPHSHSSMCLSARVCLFTCVRAAWLLAAFGFDHLASICVGQVGDGLLQRQAAHAKRGCGDVWRRPLDRGFARRRTRATARTPYPLPQSPPTNPSLFIRATLL